MKTSIYLKTVFEFCATIAVVLFIGLFLHAFGAPNFITPNMIKRNGLTDEQYEAFWKIGKNPRIDQATARSWMFRSSRYSNVTNWLGIIGKTNNFARLVVPTMETNEVLKVQVKDLTGAVSKLAKDIEQEKARADESKHNADIYKAIQKSVKRTEKNISKVIKTLEQAKKKASTEDEVALWTMMIQILQGNEPNIQE